MSARTCTHKFSVLGKCSIGSLQMEMTFHEMIFGTEAEKEIK